MATTMDANIRAGDEEASKTERDCAVCMGQFGRAEVYFRAVISGIDRRVCPRCLHILIHGMSIADARARLGISG